MNATPVEIARQIAPVEQRRSRKKPRPAVSFTNCADAFLALDPTSDSVYPSQNHNTVINWGTDLKPTADTLAEIEARYREANVPRYYVYVSPSPHTEDVSRLLEQHGYRERNRLDVLVGEATWRELPPTDLVIRAVEGDELERLASLLPPTDLWPEDRYRYLLELAKTPEFEVYFAFDNSLPVAVGVLCVDNEIGWLGKAWTAEDHRSRGAQSALIAHRINRAAECGCRWVYSETYQWILPGSFRNLTRAGLKHLYSRPIYTRQK